MNHAPYYDPSNNSNNNNNSTCGNKRSKQTTNDKVPIYQEKYTEKDIVAIKSFDNIQIKGYPNGRKGTAIQIYFQSKQFHYDTLLSPSSRNSSLHYNDEEDEDDEEESIEEQERRRLSSRPNSPSSPSSSSTTTTIKAIKPSTTTMNMNTNTNTKNPNINPSNQDNYITRKRSSAPNASTNNRFDYTTSTKERRLSMKLQKYLEHSFENEKKDDNGSSIPFNGREVLKEHGYGLEDDNDNDDNDVNDDNDGLPLPPWHPKYIVGRHHSSSSNKKKKDVHFMNENGEIFYGPILTFAIPNLIDQCQMDGTSVNTSKNNSTEDDDIDDNDDGGLNRIQEDAAPLLWKIDFPPDPSIAIEAFTVLDGTLDVHPDPKKKNNHNNNRDDDSTSSYSSCTKNECEACHPTNIYINGYQSWSYTGSVKQGDVQPKSAMPDFLSKAFNYGADVPPKANIVIDNSQWDEETNVWCCSKKRRGRNGGIEEVHMRSTINNANDGDDEYYPFHEATHYKSDFYTCVSTNNVEKMRAQSNASGYNYNHYNQQQYGGMKLDEMGGTSLVLGFLSQRKQLGLVTFDSDLERVAMHASLQGVIASRASGISTDWAYCQILPAHVYDEEPLVYYLNAVSAYNNARPLQNHPPLTGWCSWYHYYENISLKTLNANFKKMFGLKTTITQDLAIVDDGYITAWGDWDSLKPKEFPESSGGMKALADNIRMNKMIPGLWMAPFACDKHSKLAKEHPDWIIRNDEGRIANSSNCGKFFYGLDATNPAVREYAFKCIRRAVEEWGYRCLKLDFLYASCLDGNGKYDLSMTRAETMFLALQTLRAAAGPDVFLIGCGCPLGPAIGYVDGMRISADTGPTWYPDFPLPWWDHATLPSLRAMVRNSVTRASLGHRWWHNDPDCLLLGETTSLSDNEVISAASIVAMTGGMLLLSDDLALLTSDRIRVATRIFPVTGVTAVVLDLHNANSSGIPSLLRLWCTDSLETPSASNPVEVASQNSKLSAFCPTKPWKNPSSRQRNCIPVTKGLGTWSIVSLSNWLDVENIVSVPIISLLPPKAFYDPDEDGIDLGYHVYAFWSSKYIWVSNSNFDGDKTISKRLGSHETEIFHVKPVHASMPQYIGSELHFTCGYEVKHFIATPNSISLQMMNDSKRSGFVYLFLPTFKNSIHITIDGNNVRAEHVATTPEIKHGNTTYGGQIVRVYMIINGPSSNAKLDCIF